MNLNSEKKKKKRVEIVLRINESQFKENIFNRGYTKKTNVKN